MEYLKPRKIYYEPKILDYDLGQKLYQKYSNSNIEMNQIDNQREIKIRFPKRKISYIV